MDSFRTFNDRGGKFRVAVTDVCNLDCFFCHNEALPNPRREPVPLHRLTANDLLEMINAFTALGGKQVNITGGEPLARPDIIPFLSRIDKRDTIVVLNTNALLADRLLAQPKLDTVDAIFASLHSVDEIIFHRALGARHGGARRVMDNLVALKKHGYRVQINYSLGDYNKHGFDAVLDFAMEHGIDLKAIALVRPTEEQDFYRGDWIDPSFLTQRLRARGARHLGSHEGLGGRTTSYDAGGTTIKVKNVADGRLETDYCGGCAHRATCGEGIYALRVGVDGLFKPCLLAREKFIPVVRTETFAQQILSAIESMIGDFSRAQFRTGAPC